LATTQSGQVAHAIQQATGCEVELVVISTRGDQIQDRPLQDVGGKGLFTLELEEALRDGSVDLAVHSLKDMPTDDPPGLTLQAIPERADPRDVLVGKRLEDLKPGAIVGTGSVRRRLQLLALRPDLDIRGIRGNVDTRIRKMRDGAYDAIVLAAAGLARLGRSDEIDQAFSLEEMIPAVGQGALAVQCRRDDPRVHRLLDAIHHPPTATCVAAERSFLHTVSGGCSAPAACHAVFEGDQVRGEGFWAADEDSPGRRKVLRTDPMHVVAMGRALAKALTA
jgi:hydroxymethylbilane synthase